MWFLFKHQFLDPCIFGIRPGTGHSEQMCKHSCRALSRSKRQLGIAPALLWTDAWLQFPVSWDLWTLRLRLYKPLHKGFLSAMGFTGVIAKRLEFDSFLSQ